MLEVTIERSWNWEKRAALLLSYYVRLYDCPDPLKQRKVVAIVLCAAVPFSCFQCVSGQPCYSNKHCETI